MLKKIIMPSGGQNTDESMITKWYYDIGEKVKRGDVLFDIETDKATLQIESFADGFLIQKNYEEGQMAAAGEIVAYIGNQGEKIQDDKNRIDQNEDIQMKENLQDEYQPIMIDDENTNNNNNEEIGHNKTASSKRVLASPLAKETARSNHIDLQLVSEKNSGQIIHHADVLNYRMDSNNDPGEKNFYIVPNSKIRNTIASRMVKNL
ncbi:MAG: biotin/lipoyl-containing protein, partial [Eubacteriales bacterium]